MSGPRSCKMCKYCKKRPRILGSRLCAKCDKEVDGYIVRVSTQIDTRHTENTEPLFITPKFLGHGASVAQAERMAKLMRPLGWVVQVGEGPAWKFDSPGDRARFEADWKATLPLLFQRAAKE